MSKRDRELSSDIIWGVAAIAAYIGRTDRQTYYLVETGAIPAKKVGVRRIAARKSELDRALAHGGDDNEPDSRPSNVVYDYWGDVVN
jgi:hypothetical protein